MHLAALIQDLAVILGVASLVSLGFQYIRLPVVLGYLIAGLIVGPHTPPVALVHDLPNIKTLAELGVIFLMFSLGLEFSFRKLSKVGISASLTAMIEVSAMLGLGYGAARAMSMPATDSLFLAAMVSISSTTIIIKALDELKLKTRRFAEMIFGVLIVEDLVAVLILVALSTVAGARAFSGMALLLSAGKLVLVIGSWFLAGYFVVPRFVKHVGRLGNDEMLTILAIGLCLMLSVAASAFGYSVALGAFIMGSILAESTESHRIEDLIRPLRDLFAAVFFVSVGMLIDPHAILSNLPTVLVVASVVVFGKIFAVTLGALITGQTLRTAVQVGFGLAQIGEFSFIIAGLGTALHVTSDSLYPVAVTVSLITTFTTPYLIRVSHKFAVALEKRLPLRVKEGLTQYAAWSQERRADSARRQLFYRLLFRWALNGLLVTAIFIVVAELMGAAPASTWRGVAGWVAAVTLSAPFVWGMFNAFREFSLQAAVHGPEEGRPRGGTLFLMRLLTVAWMGAVSLRFLEARYAFVITTGLAAGLFGIFYRNLERSYRWFESRFLSTFETSAKSRKATDVLRHLAPWDAHLVRIKVHPNAEIAGQSVRGSQLRQRFGLNVVAIQRGLKTVVAPGPDESIYPKDELLVLGTDEQIEAIRPAIEKPPGLAERFRDLGGYHLKNHLIVEGSPLAQRTLRELGIREKYGAMVVGIERDNRRVINPESSLMLKPGDMLWLVGENERLDQAMVEWASPPA